MPPKLNEGKGSSQTRRYRSDLRRQQAELTRERIVTAAAELFAAEGYARTTLAKIAAAAGVSAETVQLYGPKAALMVAAVEYVAFGVSGEENILDMEFGRRFVCLDSSEEAIDFLVSEQTEVHQRSAGLSLALIGAAARIDRSTETGSFTAWISTSPKSTASCATWCARSARSTPPSRSCAPTSTTPGAFPTASGSSCPSRASSGS